MNGCVDIWQIALDASAEQISRDELLLDASEMARATAFRFPYLRSRFVVAHAALRRILAAELAASPAQLVFDRQAHGKPILAGDYAQSNLHFNLSHSGDMALVAVSRVGPVGVDLEQVDSLGGEQMLAVAQYFSAMEQAELARFAPTPRLAAAYRCWVRKEALLKGLGLGITAGLDGFTVSVGDKAELIACAGLGHAQRDGWWLHHLCLPSGYTGALATRGAPQEVRLRTWQLPKNSN